MSFEEELSRGQEERSFDTLYLISYYLKFISAFLLRQEFLGNLYNSRCIFVRYILRYTMKITII